jgi:hypothetical protein
MCTRLSNPRPGTRSPVTLGEQASCHTFARPTSKPRPVGSSREHHPDSSPSHRVSRLPPTPTGKLDATSALMASHLPISSELDSSRRRVRSFPTRAVVFSVWVCPRTRPDRSRLGERGMPLSCPPSACEAKAAMLASWCRQRLSGMITKKEQSYSDSSSCLGDHLHSSKHSSTPQR